MIIGWKSHTEIGLICLKCRPIYLSFDFHQMNVTSLTSVWFACVTCFYTACFQHQLAEQSVTSVTYGRGVGEGCGSAGGGRGVGEGCGSDGGGEEWGRGAVQSVELRTNNSELELSVEDLSYMYVCMYMKYMYCMHVLFHLFLSKLM